MDIEKNVPLPTKVVLERTAKNLAYPYLELEVGDSFLHPGGYTAAWLVKRRATERTGNQFVMLPEGNGFRIWRMA